jgi:hypothetical protein
VLEESTIQLAKVSTESTGKAGRAMLKALLDGEPDPDPLAELAGGRMRQKREPVAQALQGTLCEHHRFLLQSQWRQLDFFEEQGAQ